MSRMQEALKGSRLYFHLRTGLPFAGLLAGGIIIVKNIQEYKILLHKLKTQGATVSEAEAEKLAQKHGIDRKDIIKEQLLSQEMQKKKLEASLLTKGWENIRIPREEEGDPRSVQALRKLMMHEQKKSDKNTDVSEERARLLADKLDPLLEEAKEHLETGDKFLKEFEEKHKGQFGKVTKEQLYQSLQYSEFFRKHVQKGTRMLTKLEAFLEIDGVSKNQIEEMKYILDNIAKAHVEMRKGMKYCWDEKDVYINAEKNK